MSGELLKWLGVILFIKCDMAEFVTTFGYPSWATKQHPCPFCHATLETWDTITNIGPLGLPWAEKTFNDYKAACETCELWRTIDTVALFRKARARLQYDNRSTAESGRGRVLGEDLPELRLLRGDRLEPHAGMMDISKFDELEPGPNCRVLFWRRSLETAVRRRNPLYSDVTRIHPNLVFVEDWLHMCSLGIYKSFISKLWHTLFDFNIFDIQRTTPVDVYRGSCVGCVRELLFSWYNEEEANGRFHARCQDLPATIVGVSSEHVLGTWGAETNGLLLFSRVLFDKYKDRCDATVQGLLDRGLTSLLTIHTLINTHKTGLVPVREAQLFADSWKTHLRAAAQLGVNFKPKHHAMAHMVRKLLSHGAPHVWANWRDESENKLLARMALVAHRAVWARRLLGDAKRRQHREVKRQRR